MVSNEGKKGIRGLSMSEVENETDSDHMEGCQLGVSPDEESINVSRACPLSATSLH